jgi:uncharacterized protein YbjT (DUF2867 family)
MKTALIAGATGLVGSALVAELLADANYGRVVALVRRPLTITHPKLVQVTVDFDRLDQYQDALQGDDLFCCLGTTIKKAGSQAAFRRVDYDYPLQLGRLARQQGVRQFLVVSALGASPRSRVFYNRVKGELEEALADLGLPALHIFRPSLLLGERSEQRPGERIAIALSRPLTPLLVGPLRKYRPIAAAAVARAMRRVALRAERGVHAYESDQIARLAQGR